MVGGWRGSVSKPQAPGLGNPVAFLGALKSVDFQLAGHHVHDPGLKQALWVEAVHMQCWHGAESAIQAHDRQSARVLVHLAGEGVPPAAHVQRGDRRGDGG